VADELDELGVLIRAAMTMQHIWDDRDVQLAACETLRHFAGRRLL
jgi:hypothetical protein